MCTALGSGNGASHPASAYRAAEMAKVATEAKTLAVTFVSSGGGTP